MPAAGTYRLYARWSSGSLNVSDATYQVHHAGGMTPVQVNQKGSGGLWVPLGDFDFDPAAGHEVTLLGGGTGWYVTADALRFVRAGSGSVVAGEIVVDNLAAVKAGAWTLDVWTGGGALWGLNHEYRSSGGTGANSMTWTPTLASPGRYRVYARWSASSLRAPDARYTVTHDGGATEVQVDQRGSGGIWVPLGSYELTPGQGHGVVLTDQGGGFNVSGDAVRLVPEANSRAVMADAVKFVPAVTPAFPAASSSLLREYVTLNGRSLALIDGGTLYYVHADHLGTPQKMTDSSGNVVWDAVYRPFGEAESITGSAQNDQRFPGQLYDPETGFHYNYFRDYAPGLGRYMESDPIGLRGGSNTYAYVFANPIKLMDPFGLESPVDDFGAIGTTGSTGALFWGFEAMGLIGGGYASVTCCKGNTKFVFEYVKFCGGLALGVGASAGQIDGLAPECDPTDYEGFFAEGDFAAGVGIGVDIGLTSGGFVPDGFSGVNEYGPALGAGGGFKLCYYVKINEEPIGCCN